MNEAQSKFDTTFKDHGGIFILNNDGHHYDVQKVVNQLMTIISTKYPGLPLINGAFIKSPEFNACACNDETPNYYLGINIGAYLILKEMFTMIFSSKNVLPSLGNVSSLSDEKQTLHVLINNKGVYYDFQAPKTDVGINDPIRRQIGSYYYTLALDFLVCHELGHIVHGHTGYVYKKHNITYWNEIDRQNNKVDPFIRQTMEMDADSFATNMAFNEALNCIKHVDKLPGSAKYIYPDIETFLEHWIFAIYCFLRLCDLIF